MTSLDGLLTDSLVNSIIANTDLWMLSMLAADIDVMPTSTQGVLVSHNQGINWILENTGLFTSNYIWAVYEDLEGGYLAAGWGTGVYHSTCASSSLISSVAFHRGYSVILHQLRLLVTMIFQFLFFLV